MRKVIFIIVFLSFLSGCQHKVTTFDEVIENGKVEIEGIVYDVSIDGETFYEYDTDDNMIKSTTVFSDQEIDSIFIEDQKLESEFVYKNNLLLEEHRSSDKAFDRTLFYKYDSNDRVIEKVYQYENYNFVTKYEYDDGKLNQIDIDYDGKVLEYREGFVDKNNNLLSFTIYDSEYNPIGFVDNEYLENKLISTVSRISNKITELKYYKYNNLGDLIFSYTIYHDDEYIMRVNFFEYEYNKEDLPTYMKQYHVQSVIDKDKIRDYWDLETIN